MLIEGSNQWRFLLFIPEIGFRHRWLLTRWWRVHPYAAKVLLLRRVPAAPRWHLKVSACGWLADLHGNTGSPDAASGPTASAALLRQRPHPLRHSSSPTVSGEDHQSGCICSIFPPCVRRGSIVVSIQKGRSRADVWESVYFFNNWIGKAADFGWVCTWERVCLLIEWMSWSVMEMKLRQTGGLLVSRTSRAGRAAPCCRYMCVTALQMCVEGFFFLHLNIPSSNHNNMENSLSYFWNFECLKVSTSSQH